MNRLLTEHRIKESIKYILNMKYNLTYSHKYPKKTLDLYKRRVFQLAENMPKHKFTSGVTMSEQS